MDQRLFALIDDYLASVSRAVHLKSGPVDFDFGEKGEINGIDAGRLAGFAGIKLAQYGFTSKQALVACFNAEVTAGAFRSSGYILHDLRDAGA